MEGVNDWIDCILKPYSVVRVEEPDSDFLVNFTCLLQLKAAAGALLIRAPTTYFINKFLLTKHIYNCLDD